MSLADYPSNQSETTGFSVPSRRSWKKWSAVGALALAALVGLLAWRAGAAKEEKKPEAAKVFEFAPSDLVQLIPRELGRIIGVSGSINPLVSATVKSKLAAEVARVHVQEGERVVSGQLLLSLDTGEIKARLDAQNAAVAEAQARLDLALKNQTSQRQLLSQNFISQNAYDTAQNGVDVAQAALKAVQAQAEIARRALADTQVRAPFAGVVAKRWANAGEKVSPDVPLMQLVDLSKMELQAQVPVSEIPAIRVGQAVDLSVDGFDTRIFKGVIGRINPAVEAGTRSITVFVGLPNADGSLRGGMFAKGRIIANADAAVNALPLAAVQDEAGQALVFVVKNGQLERVPVQLGLRREDLGLVEVRDGPPVGTQVVAVKTDGLKHGLKASVKTPKIGG